LPRLVKKERIFTFSFSLALSRFGLAGAAFDRSSLCLFGSNPLTEEAVYEIDGFRGGGISRFCFISLSLLFLSNFSLFNVSHLFERVIQVMHAFFHPAQVDLHQILLDLLTSSSSICSILPLSRVNRHFRSIVFKRLLDVFSEIGGITHNSETGKVTVARGKGYLKIGEGQRTHVDCDPVLCGNDPRWLFAQQGWGGMKQANEAVFHSVRSHLSSTI